MGCAGSKAMLKDERVKTYNGENKRLEKDKEEQRGINQESGQQEAQALVFENKETNKAETPQKRGQENEEDGKKPPVLITEFKEKESHKDGLAPVKKDINFNIVEPTRDENVPNVPKTPIKSDKKPANNKKSMQNEIKMENVLKPNPNISNQVSINKMSNSVTQDKLINMVKSEVYNNLLNTALEEAKRSD